MNKHLCISLLLPFLGITGLISSCNLRENQTETEETSLGKSNRLPESLTISSDTERHEYFYYLGQTYFNSGKHMEAIKEYNKALNIKKDYYSAYYGRGLAKMKLKDYRGAIEDYNYAIELEPNS